MSYRCQGCRRVCTGQMRRWTSYREVWGFSGLRKEIEREVPVCQSCLGELHTGTSLALLAERAVEVVGETAQVAPPPVVVPAINTPVIQPLKAKVVENWRNRFAPIVPDPKPKPKKRSTDAKTGKVPAARKARTPRNGSPKSEGSPKPKGKRSKDEPPSP